MNLKRQLCIKAQLPKKQNGKTFPLTWNRRNNGGVGINNKFVLNSFKVKPPSFVYFTASSLILNPPSGSRHLSGGALNRVTVTWLWVFLTIFIFGASVSICGLVAVELGHGVHLLLERVWWGEDPTAIYETVRRPAYLKKWYWGVEHPVTKIRPIIIIDECGPLKDYKIRTNPPEWPGYNKTAADICYQVGYFVGMLVACGIVISLAEMADKN
jgi:hypothetical protein